MVAVVVLLTRLAGSGGLLGGNLGSPSPNPGAEPGWVVPLVLAASRATGIDPRLLAAVARVESDFTPTAVGPPVPGGPALGLTQFLPATWAEVNTIPGATPFEAAPALLATGQYLRRLGTLCCGGWSVTRALFGYNHSLAYVHQVLAVAAGYGAVFTPGYPTPEPGVSGAPLAAAVTVAAHPGGGAVLTPTGPGATGALVVRTVTPGLVIATSAATVAVCGWDGWRYATTGLTGVTVTAGEVLAPGAPIGVLALGHSLQLAINRGGAPGGDTTVDTAAWLALVAESLTGISPVSHQRENPERRVLNAPEGVHPVGGTIR